MRGEAGGVGRMRLRRYAMAAQVAACSFCLVLGALLARSLELLEAPALGFADVERTLLASVDWSAAGLDRATVETRSGALLERIAGMPGVVAAGASTMMPLGFGGHAYVTPRMEGYSPRPGEDLAVELVGATSGYLEALGVPVEEGRGIATGDGAAAAPVVVINHELARRFFPGRSALGRTLDWGDGPRRIVGVVADAVYRDLGEPPYPMAFAPMFQLAPGSWNLHVRSRGDVEKLLPALRREVARVDPALPLFDPRTLAVQATAAGFGVTFAAALASGLGGLVALLVAAGLYGLLDTVVRERRREIAVRLAIGATRGRCGGGSRGGGCGRWSSASCSELRSPSGSPACCRRTSARWIAGNRSRCRWRSGRWR